jgi:hypothetical protein
MPKPKTKKVSRTTEEQQEQRLTLLYQYAALHQTFNGELRSDDPDWLLLFRLHYSLIEMEQRHPWLKQEDLA